MVRAQKRKMEAVEWETNAQKGYFLRPQTKVAAEQRFGYKLLMLTFSMCQNHGAGGRKWQGATC